MEKHEFSVLHETDAGVMYVVDENGQEILAAPAATHKIVSIAQAEAYKEKLKRDNEGRSVDFTFTSMENIPEVIEKIPTKYCGYLLLLQCYVDFGDGTIVHGPNKPMSRKDIARKLKLSERAFRDFLHAMIDNEIIFEDKTKAGVRYRINTRYHFRGSTNNSNVVKSFTAKVRELYAEVNAKDLGLIYKLLPYVHYETNTICSNPFETNVEIIESLSKEAIAELTGFTEKSLYTKLRKLQFGDQYVFAEVVYGRKRFYKINPFVFYRKSGVPDATLREIFSIYNNYRKKRNVA